MTLTAPEAPPAHRGAPSAFARLRALLDGVPAPARAAPVALHLGECLLAPPRELLGPLADGAGWTRYPPLGGTPELRGAYRGWLHRRFGVPDGDTADGIAVEPTPGTKQALAALLALAVDRARHRGREPAVVLPNPFYPTYLAGTLAAGGRPVLYPTSDATAAAVTAAVADAPGPVAAVVLCNPGNPRGDVLDTEALRAVASVAAAAGAVLVVDECYTDLFAGTAPPGYLGPAGPAGPGPYAVLHSLSKRSAAPGLRTGFVAGDPATVAAYAAYNRACGVSSALPVCAAAAALWTDDAHVDQVRELLARNWNVADAELGDLPGYRRAPAGFYVWLPVPGGDQGADEVLTRRLWRDHAITVMPGRYLSAPDADGDDPGAGHLRIALVHPPDVLRTALAALAAEVRRGPEEGGA